MSELETIRRFEEACLTREIRDDPSALGALLTEGLVEVGSSGRIWTRREILERLPNEAPFEFELLDFATERLGESVILATYSCVLMRDGNANHTRRSSVWVFAQDRWRMHFHQGTPCGPLLSRPEYPVNETDLEALVALTRRTYTAAFGASLDPEDLASHLDETLTFSAFERAIAKDLFVFEREGDDIVGFAQIGEVEIDTAKTKRPAQQGDVELRRLYVAPEYQRSGIGMRVLSNALNLSLVREADAIYLDVWTKNENAKRLYLRSGFAEIGSTSFATASGEASDPDLILVRTRS